MCALAIGIDLGTTNSCVGVFKNGQVQIIQNEHQSYVVPSLVSFTDDGILTGHEAKNESHKYIRNTIFETKRLIGQNYRDQTIQKYINNLPYDVVDDDGFLKIKVSYQGKTQLYFPEEISAYVLQTLKEIAQSYLNQNVTKVVVTVPAYFNDIQREATKIAATIAGFQKESIHIINEPTAAALAFNYQNLKRYRRNVLVYDFGGGTFDVSIVTIGRGECKVRATKGDLHLGGTDIDTNLINYIKKDFREKFGEEISNNEQDIRRLKNACEKMKIELSGVRLTSDVDLPNLSGKDYSSLISKQKFEELNAKIFNSTLSIVEECLRNSGLSKEAIDEVVLVGGSSKIPKVQEMLRNYFGEDKINKGVNPDEAVAFGAALHATSLIGNKSEVQDVISLSLGVAAWGYLSTDIISCNTSIPARITKSFSTTSDNQELVEIGVFQGEKLLVNNNVELGSFNLTGIRKAPSGDVQIDVSFDVDSEGILNVTASETGTTNQKSIKIEVKKKGLTVDQWERRAIELEEHRKNDLKRKEFLGKKHCLEKLCNNIISDAQNIGESDSGAEIVGKCMDISDWLTNISICDQNELEEKKKELEEMCASNLIILRDN